MPPLLLVLTSALLLLSGVLLAALALPLPGVGARGARHLPDGPLLRPRGALRTLFGRIPDAAWIVAPAISAAVFLAGATVGFAPLPANLPALECGILTQMPHPLLVGLAWTPGVAIVFGTFALLVSVLAALASDDPHDPLLAQTLLSGAAIAPCGWAMAFVGHLLSLVSS